MHSSHSNLFHNIFRLTNNLNSLHSLEQQRKLLIKGQAKS